MRVLDRGAGEEVEGEDECEVKVGGARKSKSRGIDNREWPHGVKWNCRALAIPGNDMIAFHNLPRTVLPVHIIAIKLDGSDEVVWDATIESETFTIPPLEKIYKCPIRVRVRWGSEREIVM